MLNTFTTCFLYALSPFYHRVGHVLPSSTSLAGLLSDVCDDISYTNIYPSHQHCENPSDNDGDTDTEEVVSLEITPAENTETTNRWENSLSPETSMQVGQSINEETNAHFIEVKKEMDEEDDADPLVQSAVFLRTEQTVANASSVFIETLRPPSKPMIIIHSDNLPDVIVFRKSEQHLAPSSSPSSSRLSGSQVNVSSEMAVFHKVPSVQDVAISLKLLEKTEALEDEDPETSVTKKNMNFMEQVRRMEGLQLKQRKDPKPKVSIKSAIAERDRLMRKLLQSQQKTGTKHENAACIRTSE